MHRIFLAVSIYLFLSGTLCAQSVAPGFWRATLTRVDGRKIPFLIHINTDNSYPDIAIVNGKENLHLKNIQPYRDSVNAELPVFESSFRVAMANADQINGYWIRQGATSESRLPISLSPNEQRFDALYGNATENVTGKWAVTFTDAQGKGEPAIGIFSQKDNEVTGSILTPSGDYRYLAGIVTGDSLFLSTFDGVHALVFAAKVNGKTKKLSGNFWSGASYSATVSGQRENNPTLPNTAAMYLKNKDSSKLDFQFKDLDGKIVSIKDERFKNKVVIIDIMGSWCPNCMDETAFLSDFYKKNKDKGVEVIGLAYEYTTDYNRSKKSLEKFKTLFDIQYPVLITGVAVSDPARTEKTLPQLTPIKMFPTTIILDKNGKIADIDTGFEGPGTGEYYEKFVEDFTARIDKLLQ